MSTTISREILPMSTRFNESGEIVSKLKPMFALDEERVCDIIGCIGIEPSNCATARARAQQLLPKEIPDKMKDDAQMTAYILGPWITLHFPEIKWTWELVANVQGIKGTLPNGSYIRMYIPPHLYGLKVCMCDIEGQPIKREGFKMEGLVYNRTELEEFVDECVQYVVG